MLGPLTPRLYASLQALCCLARASGPLQAHEIALNTGLPPAQTAKILQMVSWAGFVGSRRGTKGGFWLLRPAERIRVTDVVDFFARRTPDRADSRRDPILAALAPAMAKCKKQLDRISVADLAKAPCCVQGQKRSSSPPPPQRR